MSEQQVYPAKTIASLLDITERRVGQLVKEGIIPKTDRGRYQLFPVVQGYIKFLRERKLGKAVVSLDEARQRKLAAEAEMAEIELAKARADVVRVEDVARQWENILGDVRTRFLALPSKLAPVIAVENKQAIVKEMIEDGINTALGQLSAGISDDARGNGEFEQGDKVKPGEAGTTAETNDIAMGR
jgi:phage terminase Nu1 subunit (DNA packaging protein)